jgi:diguanylate cyclase (GGDEF)-like protein/PAS domain S-box-containing protein
MAARVSVDVDVVPERHIHSPEEGFDPARPFAWGPEALIVLRGFRVMDASQSASELIARDLTGSDIRTAIPGWPEDPDPSAPFDAILRVNDGDLPIEVRARILPDGLVVASIRDARALIAGREAQALLVEAEQKYRGLVEQIPAVVYSDDGQFTNYVSPQIEEILGVTATEYLADPDMWMRMVHPDDRATAEAESDAFLAGHGGDLTDYRMVRSDGRIVWIRDRAFAHRDEEGRVIWEQGILFDVTELKDAEARIAHMAFHDGLTGLANRQLFEETLELALERARRDRSVVAVLFLDLDNFKQVNDTFGHHAGDLLLTEVAQRLRDSTRGTDLVARQGGDEFLILLADLETTDAGTTLSTLAGRIQQALAQPFRLYGVDLAPSASIGISEFPNDAYDAETLLKNADIVMYRAKREGPGRHQFFTPEPTEPAIR